MRSKEEMEKMIEAILSDIEECHEVIEDIQAKEYPPHEEAQELRKYEDIDIKLRARLEMLKWVLEKQG